MHMDRSKTKYSLVNKHSSRNLAEVRENLIRREQEEVKAIEEKLTPEERRMRTRTLIASLAALFSINTLLLCAEAVLPTYIEKHHKAYIDESKTALIIA